MRKDIGAQASVLFFFVVLPVSKPWLFGALTLVTLEVIADFGTVSIFGVNTFTTAIFKLWTGFFSLQTAMQLASLLLLATLVFYLLIEVFNDRRQYTVYDSKQRYRRIHLTGWKKWGVFAFSSLLVCFTCIVPIAVLVFWLVEGWDKALLVGSHLPLRNSVIIAVVVGLLATGVSLLLNLSKYTLPKTVFLKTMTKFLVLGYAIPSSVLAVSVYAFCSFFLNRFLPSMNYLLTSSLLVLFFALVVRYTAIFTLNIDRALKRIPHSLYDASLSLGQSSFSMFRRVHLPLLLPSIAYTFLIVVIETLKEIPLTLMTRPFGWDTLAVKIFQFTSEGQWERASFPATLLVAISILPIYLFSVLINKRNGVVRN